MVKKALRSELRVGKSRPRLNLWRVFRIALSDQEFLGRLQTLRDNFLRTVNIADLDKVTELRILDTLLWRREG